MKRFYFPLLFVLSLIINQPISAQEGAFLLDSVAKYTKAFYNPELVMKQKYYYNLDNKVKLIKTYKNKNGFPDTANWQYINKESFLYDAQSRILTDLFEVREFDSINWKYDNKIIYDYNDSAQSKSTAFWYEQFNEWRNGMKYIDSIEPPGSFYKSFLEQIWDDDMNDWENEVWFDTIYHPNGLIDSIVSWYYYMDTISGLGSKFYDYSNYPDTLYIYVQSTASTSDDIHVIYYTDDSLIKYDYDYILDNGIRKKMFREIYTYDEFGHLIKYQFERWDSDYNQWMGWYTYKYFYNDAGLLIEMDDCSNDQRTTYEYNDEDLLSKKVFYHGPLTDIYYYFYTYLYVDVPDNYLKPENELLLYPNPTVDNLYFNELNGTEKHYSIVDITGRLIKKGSLAKEEKMIDVSVVPAGSYFILLTDGQNHYTGKFIKY